MLSLLDQVTESQRKTQHSLPCLPLFQFNCPSSALSTAYNLPRSFTASFVNEGDQVIDRIKDDNKYRGLTPLTTVWSSSGRLTASHTNFPPLTIMEASASTRKASVSNTAGDSPSTSTHSDHPSASAAVVTGASASPLSTRKKPGRGPGKKDAKEKATVSVRWDDGDLTERLIVAIEGNDRWAGVFTSPNAAEGVNPIRPPPQVAKRDLQREIAKYLFASDVRFDVDDKRILESLAVSVKNKLFKLTTLHTECKQELGHIGDLKSERDIPQGSEQAVTWARVRVKFPQFFRIRDLMKKTPLSIDTPAGSEEPTSERSPSRPRADTGATSSTSHSTAVPPSPMNPLQFQGSSSNSSSALRGAVDLPKGLPPAPTTYVEPSSSSSAAGSSYMGYHGAATYPQQNPGFGPPSDGYGYPAPPPQAPRRATSSQGASASYNPSHPNTGASQSSTNVGYTPAMPSTATSSSNYHQPQPQSRHYYGPPSLSNSTVPSSAAIGGGGGVYNPQLPQPPITASPRPRGGGGSGSASSARGVGRGTNTATPDPPMSTISPAPRDQSTPSPPLSQTIQAIVSSLTDKKDKDKAREHELEVMRLQREEAERVRWHQREMMRLRIQLIRAERAAGIRSAPEATGGVEDDLALSSGLGGGVEDMDEGDGEGELEEDMMLEAELSNSHNHHHHHHSSPKQHRHPDAQHPPS
ncbi:hypothetical protein FRB94_009110 [Tulasnella sp. JGI-2019a]|nr:hypothetical protein FRB94_009110 [Tulasnella sp. JGI-2019a]